MSNLQCGADTTGTDERYAAEMGELWTGLSRTLARLDRSPPTPDRLDDVRAELARGVCSTRCTSRASTPTASRRRPAPRPRTPSSRTRSRCARDATAEVAEARDRSGAPKASSRCCTNGAARSFRVRLARLRLATPVARRETLGELPRRRHRTAARRVPARARRRARVRRRRDARRSGRSGRPACSRSARPCSRTGRNHRRPPGVCLLEMVNRAPHARGRGAGDGSRRAASASDPAVPRSRPGGAFSAHSTRSRRRSRSGRRTRPLSRASDRRARAARGSRTARARPSTR